MKIRVLTVGKPALSWAKDAVDDYMKRLTRSVQIEWRVIKSSRKPEQSALEMLEESEGTWRVVMDERGREFTSRGLGDWVAKQENGGRKAVSFLVGGADGHHACVREAADEVWSLSKMTLQHEFAFVLLLEQLYRAKSILAGSPYHRD